MTTMMKGSDMNELNQIRERFLADARQHFFAGNTDSNTSHCTARLNSNTGCTSIGAPHFRQSGT